jgi:Flp pilus assembly pilin Flp
VHHATAPPAAPAGSRRGSDPGASSVEFGVLVAAVAGVVLLALTGLVHVIGARIDCLSEAVQGSGSSAGACDDGAGPPGQQEDPLAPIPTSDGPTTAPTTTATTTATTTVPQTPAPTSQSPTPSSESPSPPSETPSPPSETPASTSGTPTGGP